MKHYDDLEWLFYKERIISKEKSKEMEEHLYICNQCMNTFLSLIDNYEIDKAEKSISSNFTNSVMNSIEKPNMTFKNIFGYYVAVATVVVILTWGGFYSGLVDTLPQVAKSTINNSQLSAPEMVFSMSEEIVNKTSSFINNFQKNERKEELK